MYNIITDQFYTLYKVLDMKKIIVVFLCLIITLSVTLTGCDVVELVSNIGDNLGDDLLGGLLNTKGTEGVVYELSDDGKYATVVGYEGTKTVVTIASKYDGVPVTHIGDYAFVDCTYLTKIVIPNSITSIGNSAFYRCSSLTSVTKGTGVKSIGDYAFYDCSSLKSVTIGESVKSIGDYAFYDCSSLKSVTIGESVKSIGDYAFYDCSSLTEITIPNSVRSIGDRAFASCSQLNSITVEKENKKYHSSGNCLIETASKTLIAGCKNSIIPSDGSVTSIGDYAFYRCSSLTRTIIPNSVKSIGRCAFSDCSSLTSATIGESVTSIGYGAFSGCSSLKSVIFKNTNGWSADETSISNSDLSNTSTAAWYLTIYCHDDWNRS